MNESKLHSEGKHSFGREFHNAEVQGIKMLLVNLHYTLSTRFILWQGKIYFYYLFLKSQLCCNQQSYQTLTLSHDRRHCQTREVIPFSVNFVHTSLEPPFPSLHLWEVKGFCRTSKTLFCSYEGKE